MGSRAAEPARVPATPPGAQTRPAPCSPAEPLRAGRTRGSGCPAHPGPTALHTAHLHASSLHLRQWQDAFVQWATHNQGAPNQATSAMSMKQVGTSVCRLPEPKGHPAAIMCPTTLHILPRAAARLQHVPPATLGCSLRPLWASQLRLCHRHCIQGAATAVKPWQPH